MYLGKIVELGPTVEILATPRHPYTQKLIGSVPKLTQGAVLPEPLKGDVPSAMNPPTGCHFHPRCPKFNGPQGQKNLPGCATDLPALDARGNHASVVRCHYPEKPSTERSR